MAGFGCLFLFLPVAFIHATFCALMFLACLQPRTALQLSYRLHEEMAAELGSQYGYRTVHTLSVQVQEQEHTNGKGREGSKAGKKAGGPGLPDWMDGLVSDRNRGSGD